MATRKRHSTPSDHGDASAAPLAEVQLLLARALDAQSEALKLLAGAVSASAGGASHGEPMYPGEFSVTENGRVAFTTRNGTLTEEQLAQAAKTLEFVFSLDATHITPDDDREKLMLALANFLSHHTRGGRKLLAKASCCHA